MSERFQAYFESLERLSSDDLDRSAARLVLVEKRSTARLIAHLAEISRRKAELERGYSGLFEYCLKRLNLSEGSVALRIQVANVARRFPQILAALADGKISLSVAGRLAPHLSEGNVEKLLGDCSGMTRREAEEYLVRMAPKPVFDPSIRARPVSRAGAESARSAPGDESFAKENGAPAPTAPETRPPEGHGNSSAPGLLEPARPEVFNFRFAAGKEFKDRFTRLAEVLGFENPVRDMAEILERAIDIALEKKDPMKRRERRLERESRREAAETAEPPRPDKAATGPAGSRAVPAAARERERRQKRESRREAAEAAEPPRPDKAATGPAGSRAVPAAARERVLERAGYRCEYRGSDGTRCTCRTGLEIEHLKPFAIFRSHDEKHLRAYCSRHNRLSAERVYGAGFIREKIEARRRAGEARAVLNSTGGT